MRIRTHAFRLLAFRSSMVATAKFKINIQSFIRVFSECFSVFFRVSQRKNQSFADLLTCVVKKKFRVFSDYIAENQCQSILVKKTCRSTSL